MNKNLFLFGLTQDHLLPYEDTFLHPHTIRSLEKLKEVAFKEGIEIKVLSGFRSFAIQKSIWNKKASGEKALLNDQAKALDYHSLTEQEILQAIMRWSALPGSSRHHWGSDLDIIDKKALEKNKNYEIQLIPSEYQDDGIFYQLGAFLNQVDLNQFGFFRPYQKDLGGVAVEPWHLSQQEVSKRNLELFSIDIFEEFYQDPFNDDILLIELIRDQYEEIYLRYITNIN